MKINKKLIGIGVASFGILFSVGGAFALYQQSAQNVSFGISAGVYAGANGTVTYRINNHAGNSEVLPSYLKTDGSLNDGAGLNSTYTQVEYVMALSANYAGDLNAQDYVVGNIAISVTDIPAAYQGKLSIWAVVEGYTAGSLGEHTYRTALMNSDFAITNEATSYSDNKDVVVSTAGTQALHIYLKYNLEGVDTLTQDEASLGYTLNVTWGAPSNNFVPAYVVGDQGGWATLPEFAMLPNMNKAYAEGWEWIYNNLPGTAGPGAKCRIGETVSTGSNAELDPAKSYTVYWDGSGDASFNEIVLP